MPLTIVNFALLSITASDKIMSFLGLTDTLGFVLVFVPSGFLGVLFGGYILENRIKFPQERELEERKRSPNWTENFENQKDFNERLIRIENAVNPHKRERDGGDML